MCCHVARNFVVDSSYNRVSGRVGLLIISIFGGDGGGVLMWFVYPTPSVVCLSYYLMFLCFLYFWGARLSVRWSDLILMIICFLCIGRLLRRFLVLCGL